MAGTVPAVPDPRNPRAGTGQRRAVAPPSSRVNGSLAPRHRVPADTVRASAWQDLANELWITLDQPQVPGYPASRVQQVLEGELQPDPMFFIALHGALASAAARLTPRQRARLLVGAGEVPQRDGVSMPHTAATNERGRDSRRFPARTAVEMKRPGAPERLSRVHGAFAAVSGAGAMDDAWSTAVRDMVEPDPAGVETVVEFVAALRALVKNSGLRYRELEQRAKTMDLWLPRSTVSGALNRETLPKAELLGALTAALGLSPEEQGRWKATRDRLSRPRQRRRTRSST